MLFICRHFKVEGLSVLQLTIEGCCDPDKTRRKAANDVAKAYEGHPVGSMRAGLLDRFAGPRAKRQLSGSYNLTAIIDGRQEEIAYEQL